MPPKVSTHTKPDPENSLIRALRMVKAHFEQRAEDGALWLMPPARACEEEIRREIERMRRTGEASS